jgi:hypothetical protein
MTSPVPPQPLSEGLRTKAIAEVKQHLIQDPTIEIEEADACAVAIRIVDRVYAHVAYHYRLHLPKLDEPEAGLEAHERAYIISLYKRFYKTEIKACRKAMVDDMIATGIDVFTAMRIYYEIRGMKQVPLEGMRKVSA